MNCQNCNQPLDPGAAFCGNCGQPVVAQAQPLSPPSPTPPPQAAPLQQTVTNPAVPLSAPATQQIPQPAVTVAQPFQPANPASQPVVSGVAAGPAVINAAGTLPQPNTIAPQQQAVVPAYAQAPPPSYGHAPGEKKAIIGFALAILSLPGAIIPILGFILGITGVILGTLSMRNKKLWAVLSMVFGSLGILLSIAVFILAIQNRQAASVSESVKSGTAQTVANSCFTMKLPKDLKVNNDASSCKVQAMDGESSETSTVVYAIDSFYKSSVTSTNFLSMAAQVAPSIAKEASSGDGTVTIASQRQGTFVGQPAYYIDLNVSDGSKAQMALIFDEANNGDNIFVIVKGVRNGSTALSDLESGFVWK